jgi:hypothetical protein
LNMNCQSPWLPLVALSSTRGAAPNSALERQ